MKKLPTKLKKLDPTTKKSMDMTVFAEDSYFCLRDMNEKQTSMAYLEQIAKSLVDWSGKETSLSIEQFCADLGIGNKTFYRWSAKSKPFKEAHEYAVMAIGARREIGALQNKYNSAVSLTSLPMFLDRYKDAMVFKEQIRAKAMSDNSTEPKVIVIERMPNDPLVPPKKVIQ